MTSPPSTAQRLRFVEQRGGQHVRIVLEPLGHVVGDVVERVRPRRPAHAGLAVAGQVGADGLAVTLQMVGDRRDRPVLLSQR